MKNEDSWIKQKNIIKSKQLPWFGKLNNNKENIVKCSNDSSDSEENKIIYRSNGIQNLNKSYETVPKSSTSIESPQPPPSECSKSLSVFPNITVRQQLSSNQIDTSSSKLKLDSSKNQVRKGMENVKRQTVPSWRKETKNDEIVKDIEVKSAVDNTSLPSMNFSVHPIKQQWPPPKDSAEIEKEEETKNWSLDQTERNKIKLKLENFIGGAKRRMDDDDKENKVTSPTSAEKIANENVAKVAANDKIEIQSENQADEKEIPKKSKNITKETLMKLLKAEKEEQSSTEKDSSSAVIKCGLPENQRPTERENSTDVEKCIKQLRNNDPSLEEVNLNNMKRTPVEVVKRLLDAAKENSYLKKLSFVNMGLNDNALEILLEVVETNSCLECINLETNYLSGGFLSRLFQSCLKLQTLRELKVVNQSMTLGNDAELSIMRSVFQNRGFYKVSVDLRLPEARQKVDQTIIRNGELRRLKRKIDAFDVAKE